MDKLLNEVKRFKFSLGRVASKALFKQKLAILYNTGMLFIKLWEWLIQTNKTTFVYYANLDQNKEATMIDMVGGWQW